MRSQAFENGDDVPIIEFSALKILSYVADAYLSLVDMLEKIDARIAAGLNNVTETTSSNSEEFIDMFRQDVRFLEKVAQLIISLNIFK